MRTQSILVAICLTAALLLRLPLMDWLGSFAGTLDDPGPYSVNALAYADVVLVAVLHAVAAIIIASLAGVGRWRLLPTALLATGASIAVYLAVVFVVAFLPSGIWRALGSDVGFALVLLGWSTLTVLLARIAAHKMHS